MYTWAGSLTITPDPYQALGLGPLAVSRRRHLLAAAAGDTHIDAGRQLLQASGEAAVDVTVQGSITAAEASTISPSTDADTARGDTNAWVEPSGAVKILERDTVSVVVWDCGRTHVSCGGAGEVTAACHVLVGAGLHAYHG